METPRRRRERFFELIARRSLRPNWQSDRDVRNCKSKHRANQVSTPATSYEPARIPSPAGFMNGPAQPAATANLAGTVLVTAAGGSRRRYAQKALHAA